MKKVFSIFLVFIICIGTLVGSTNKGCIDAQLVTLNYDEIKDKLIRFHVIANSDSDEDQAVKLLVRDEVIDYINVQLKDATGNNLNCIKIKPDSATTVTVDCIVYFSDEIKKMFAEDHKLNPLIKHHIYSIATFKGIYIARQQINIPVNEIVNNSFMHLTFTFKIPYKVKNYYTKETKITQCELVLAYSTKELGEIGISESIRVGTFLKTTIPVYED